MKISVFSLCVAASFATYGSVQADVLDCTVKAGRALGGWITDRYVFKYDPAGPDAQVIDGVIQGVYGKPIAAEHKATSKKTVFTWAVETSDSGGQQATIFYRAAYFPARKEVTIVALPGGYSNNFDARGTCKKQ